MDKTTAIKNMEDFIRNELLKSLTNDEVRAIVKEAVILNKKSEKGIMTAEKLLRTKLFNTPNI